MLNRNLLLALAVAGFSLSGTNKISFAGTPTMTAAHAVSFALADKKEADDDKDDEKGEKKEKHEEKEIEETVPMNLVPQAVLDAVKKEVPNGTITEAELEAKHGHIMYSFDVKDGAMAYDVKITVDGKFFSKKVDDDKDDEKDEKGGKEAKPAEKK
jgi:uncharacterized membrane protein YkoI